MSINFNSNVYGITGTGNKVKIGTVKETVEDAFPLGGKIFYIDSKDNGAIYHFFDTHGEEITDVKVGDQPYAYTIDGTPKFDKYYIFPNVIYHSNRWTYYKDGAYVYKAIGGTKIKFGAGKSNTNIVMSADDGAYITENSNGKPTIWYKIKLLNDSVYNGVSDWYVPSNAEMVALKDAKDRNGNVLTNVFDSNQYRFIWSSKEDTATSAHYWNSQSNPQNFETFDKYAENTLVPIRSF